MGVRAGAGAISAESRSKGGGVKKYHDGGWIGEDERLSITQTGERVLSRDEVSRMGGPTAVDRQAMGGVGSRVVVNVTALDALSAARAFVGEVGEGLKQAVRSGHGAVPALLGVSPR